MNLAKGKDVHERIKTIEDAKTFILEHIAENVDFEFKKSDLANLTPILYQLEERMELYKLPKFSTFKKSTERNADASVSRDGKEFSISTAFLRTPDKVYEKLEQFQKKYGYRYRAVADRDDYVRATVDHELGHTIATKYFLSRGELDHAFSKDLRNALGYYATTSPDEYWAECVSAYFGPLHKEMNEREIGLFEGFFEKNGFSLKDLRMANLDANYPRMMKALFKEEGASLRIELLEDPAVTGFIDAHASVLDSAFKKVGMSDRMRSRLQESDWIFSGMKTFHELNEAFPSLLDENGERKPFERFLSDVQSIDETYNRHYLRAEYNYAEASAEMAAKWEDIERDGDDYNLQYRTAGDDKVRPEHAALHGVTLPPSDPFWDEYYPPNGWNCRCTVVQVLKDKYPTTDRVDALRRGQEALAKDTKGMFRFNSGKQGKTFPDYNPYTIKDCNTCTRKLELGADLAPNQLCQACPLIRSMAKKESTDALTEQDRFGIRKASEEWADRHLPEMTLPTGQKAKRLVVDNNGRSLIVSKGFFSKTFSQNAKRGRLGETMELATKIDHWLPSATLVGIEPGIHHPCGFLVYEAVVDGVTVQCKVKDQADKMVYTMRIKQEKD